MSRFLLLFFTTFLFSSTVYAECAREDVDHYLSKGFTPDQIVQLCGKQEEQKVTTTKNTQVEDAQVTDDQQAMEKPLPDYDTIFKITDSEINDNTWSFIKEEKLKYGEKDVLGRYPEVKIRVLHKVDIRSMRVVKRKSKIPFFRGATLLVSANLEYEITPLKELKKGAQEAIDKFESDELANNAFSLVVHNDVSLDRADLALSKILP